MYCQTCDNEMSKVFNSNWKKRPATETINFRGKTLKVCKSCKKSAQLIEIKRESSNYKRANRRLKS